MSEEKSRIVPNTFQTPNVLVDDYMHHLTGNETKCYLVIVRKTLGWLKRRDRLALSQIAELAGLGDGPTRESMKELCKYGLVNKTAENDPFKNQGPEYELELDDMKINIAGLVNRDNARKAIADKQTSKAREKLKLKKIHPLLSTEPPIVEQTTPPIVEQTTQKPLSKAIKKIDTRPDFANLNPIDYHRIPELRLFIQATSWHPGSFVAEGIYDLIQASPEKLTKETIAAAFKEWTMRGYKSSNVIGYLEWARDGIPPRKAQSNGFNRSNGPQRERAVISEPSAADVETARAVLAMQTA